MRVRKPYSRFLQGRDAIKGTANGLLPHGWRRFLTGNERVGFRRRDRAVPRYWFSGNLVRRL